MWPPPLKSQLSTPDEQPAHSPIPLLLPSPIPLLLPVPQEYFWPLPTVYHLLLPVPLDYFWPASYLPPPLPPDPNKRGPGAAIRAVHHHHPTGEVPLSPQLTYPFTALQELSASPTSSSPSSPSSPTPPSLLVYSLSPTSLPVSPSPSLPPRTSLLQDSRPKSLYFKMEHLWLSK